MESSINEEVRFSEVNVIAATFVDELEAKQIEHKSWYQPLENQQEEAFGDAMREALTMGKSIAAMQKRRMDDAVLFHTTLATASVLGANLIQRYKSLDKNEDALIAGQFLTILQAAQNKMRNWIENGKPIGETSETSSQQTGDLVVGNVSFRLGNMRDTEILNQSDLIILPISTGGKIDNDTLAFARNIQLEMPQRKLLLGQVSIISFPIRKTTPFFGGWACAYTENGGSEYNVIENICKSLAEESRRNSIEFISLPLMGAENGVLSSIEVAKFYATFLHQPSGNSRFVVSIPTSEIFSQIKKYFNENGFTTAGPDQPELIQVTRDGRGVTIGPLNNSAPPVRPKKDEPDIKSRLISDTFTADETDVLQYDVIAQNLFAIMTDKGTNPPLNIGIFAPWGRGKTSLMKRLQLKFDEARNKDLAEQNRTPRKLAGWKALRHWLRSEEIDIKPQLPYATVWFNPWNYQSSDMIWAGMADAVIEQTVSQIPSQTEREIFWMQLQMARLAKEKIRKDIQSRILSYLILLFLWATLVLLAIFLFGFNKLVTSIGLGTGVAVFGLIRLIAGQINPISKSLREAFDKYSEAPKYQEKTGTFHEVQADLNKVLDLCIDGTKPLVIFVDDLDRCSPSKVVEVVEAINVFINGRFNTKCYFILGMDGELVAGALDVSYEKMKGKLGSREMDQGSIGWYFLDKFIQLPYFIPVMSESKKKEYLSNLLSEKQIPDTTDRPGSVAKDPSAPADMVKVGEVAKTVLSTSDNQESSQVIKDAGLSSAEQKELDKLILQNQVESEKQNETIQKQVSAYAPFISSDPRSLKRFANLLRFYCAYQFLRMKKGQPYVEAPILAKWLAIMLKFPQLVRWIQWDSENKSGIHTAAEEKVKLLDDLLEGFLKNKGDLEFTGWLKYEVPASLSNNGEVFLITRFDDVPWLRSRKLFDILMNERAALSSFKNALECNVW